MQKKLRTKLKNILSLEKIYKKLKINQLFYQEQRKIIKDIETQNYLQKDLNQLLRKTKKKNKRIIQ